MLQALDAAIQVALLSFSVSDIPELRSPVTAIRTIRPELSTWNTVSIRIIAEIKKLE